MVTELRNRERGRFGRTVEKLPVKIQVGARGNKIGPDWIAIDLFDKSPLIDHNWDLHNLPLEDCSVDCFMCNAILEHVYEPQIAIYEMYRTLKVGGNIWVEVPFNQFSHSHPHDFRRWTVQGLDWEMRRFSRVASGVANTIRHEVKKVANAINTESKAPKIDEEQVSAIEKIAEEYANSSMPLRLYSGTFFWGVKEAHNIDECEEKYMALLRVQVQKAAGQTVG